MNCELENRAGEQGGALPPIPGLTINCEKCHSALLFEDGMLPHVCPHCGYYLRPETNSVWSHFLFVLRHRYFTWRGRATRKEFWSFELIAHSILILLYVLSIYFADVMYNKGCMSMLIPLVYISLVSFSIYIFFIGIPQFFLIARRFHDIGMSAVAVIIHLVLFCALIATMAITIAMGPYDLRSDVDLETQSNPEIADIQLDERSAVDDGDISEANSQNEVFPLILLATVMNMGLEGLNVLFLIISFINSSPGTNRFGPSRKYPIAV